jgi:hypothetical protein
VLKQAHAYDYGERVKMANMEDLVVTFMFFSKSNLTNFSKEEL